MPTSLPVPVGPETPRLLVQTFGPLAITQVDPLTGTHTRIEQARLYGLSAGSNLTLLKTLLCQPARFAKVDQLLEWLWPESPYGTARERLKDVVSGLRVFLRPPNSEAKIVYHVPSLPKRDSGFRLESYPFLWADADAFSWLVTHAAACDHLRQDAWPWWERAFLLASRGPFLVEDPYSEWATKRRREIDGQYRQCVRRLVVGWLQRGQEAQALQVLRTYWQSHPEDEDLVRPLLKLLADQGLYQEAEQVYECLRLFLEELGSVPDERTVQLRDYARTRPLLSEDLLVHQPALPAIQEPLLLGPDASSGVTGPAAGRSLVVQPTSFEVTCEPASPTLDALGALLAGALSPFQVSAEDCATYFGEKQVQLLSWLDRSGPACTRSSRATPDDNCSQC
jgi:DNA-binding SARP family transcriptional activator